METLYKIIIVVSSAVLLAVGITLAIYYGTRTVATDESTELTESSVTNITEAQSSTQSSMTSTGTGEESEQSQTETETDVESVSGSTEEDGENEESSTVEIENGSDDEVSAHEEDVSIINYDTYDMNDVEQSTLSLIMAEGSTIEEEDNTIVYSDGDSTWTITQDIDPSTISISISSSSDSNSSTSTSTSTSTSNNCYTCGCITADTADYWTNSTIGSISTNSFWFAVPPCISMTGLYYVNAQDLTISNSSDTTSRLYARRIVNDDGSITGELLWSIGNSPAFMDDSVDSSSLIYMKNAMDNLYYYLIAVSPNWYDVNDDGTREYQRIYFKVDTSNNIIGVKKTQKEVNAYKNSDVDTNGYNEWLELIWTPALANSYSDQTTSEIPYYSGSPGDYSILLRPSRIPDSKQCLGTNGTIRGFTGAATDINDLTFMESSINDLNKSIVVKFTQMDTVVTLDDDGNPISLSVSDF